jgi:hypothetical protein
VQDTTNTEAGGGLIYLASPYSHADEAVREQRFHAVCEAAARLMDAGHLIFSPIAHSHCIALAGKLPTDYRFWRRYDEAMLRAAGELWVLMLPGWHVSTGVAEETAYATGLGKPVRYVDPCTLRVSRVGCIRREPAGEAAR